MTYMLTTVVVFCTCLGTGGEALKCYTCRSDVISNCDDPFYAKGVDMPTCHDMDQGTCTKIKTDDLVSRGCGLTSYCQATVTGGENSCKEASGKTRCCCSGDGCNSATTRCADYVAMSAMMLFSARAANAFLR